MIENKQKSFSWRTLILCTIVFFSLWTLHEFYTKQWIASALSGLSGAIVLSIIKVLFWCVPWLILLQRNKDKVFVSMYDMFSNKINFLKVLPYFLVFAVYLLGTSFILNGNIAVRETFKPIDLIGKFLFVGITEEMFFRGFLLNTFLMKLKKWQAVLLSSILFLIIHFPSWIFNGVFSTSMLSGGFLIILLLSVIFSVSFIKTKNILVPIALHMFWDLLTILFHT